jgi:tetratricopeptide (TPR) repeat protein
VQTNLASGPALAAALFAFLTGVGACRGESVAARDASATLRSGTAAEPLRIALVSHEGDKGIDADIRAAQAKVAERVDMARLERLATLFIGKARSSGDPGFYTQAEACSAAMAGLPEGAHAALLVRGHVRHALHDFAAAEGIARQLVQQRGLFLDLGLLGDVLLDLGRTDEARTVYQRMLDLRPCLQSYARAAQLRWLGGDHAGCRELLGLAASAGSNRDPESLAWVRARQAQLELQANDIAAARQFADAALALLPELPAACLTAGRVALAERNVAAALPHLAAASSAYPLPEHLWAQADALRAAGDVAAAERVEAEMLQTGEREDPRTFALWLATVRRDPQTALRLAQAEYRQRQDLYTADALAVAQLMVGDVAAAAALLDPVLTAGPRDARLSLHGAMLAEARGDRAAMQPFLAAAESGRAALLPSEQSLLADLVRRR